MVSIITGIFCFGMCVLYFIIFGDICGSLVADLFADGDDNALIASKEIYVVLTSIFLFPLIIKKELKEMEIASMVLAIGMTSFVCIFTFQILYEGIPEKNDSKFSDYMVFTPNLKLIRSSSMILVAFFS